MNGSYLASSMVGIRDNGLFRINLQSCDVLGSCEVSKGFVKMYKKSVHDIGPDLKLIEEVNHLGISKFSIVGLLSLSEDGGWFRMEKLVDALQVNAVITADNGSEWRVTSVSVESPHAALVKMVCVGGANKVMMVPKKG